MKRVLSVCLLLALAVPVYAQDLKVEGEGVKTVKVDRVVVVKEDRWVASSFPFRVKANPGAGYYFWLHPSSITSDRKFHILEVTAAPKGEHTFTCEALSAKLNKETGEIVFAVKVHTVVVIVGEIAPPKPPDPKPDPDPKPEPGPPPIPGDGFRVLFLFESATLGKLPSSQISALHSLEIRSYLKAKCAKVNGHPEARWFDKDVELKDESQLWRDAVKRAKDKATELPWVIVSSSKAHYEGPMPRTIAEVMVLLRKYGD